MATVENVNPEKEKVPASWVPTVIRGGKGTPEGPKTNWLKDLEQGQWFIAQSKSTTVDCVIYFVKFQWDVATLLFSHTEGNRPVVSEEFSKHYKLIKLLDKEEPLDGNSSEL
jgi:hypothetical protein